MNVRWIGRYAIEATVAIPQAAINVLVQQATNSVTLQMHVKVRISFMLQIQRH